MTLQQIQAAIDADPQVRQILAQNKARGTFLDAETTKRLSDYLSTSRPDLATAIEALPPSGNGKGRWGWSGRGGQLGWSEDVSPLRAALPGIIGAATIGTAGALGALSGPATSAGAAGAEAVAPAATSAAPVGAGAAGAAGAGAGMSSWLDPILNYAVPTIGGLVSAGMQASANNNATAAQTEYLNRALEAAKEEQQYRRGFDENERDYSRSKYGEERDYGRGQYSNYLSRLDPYRTAGQSSLGRVERLLSGQSGAVQSQGMVTLASPDGKERMSVPSDQVAHFQRLGAVRV